MRNLLKIINPPTAVFACNDMMALGAMRAVNDCGLQIPEDISLIGFDNIPISKSVYPALTTIAQPIKEMADLIVGMLVNRITQKKNNRRTNEEIGEYNRIVLETRLIERGTCRSLD